MKKQNFIIIVSIVIVISISWVLLTPIIFPHNSTSADTAAVHKGFQAPDFSLETSSGETLSLTDYEGQPVLVFFWASWCSVCKRTMPGLQSVYEDYAPMGFTILAVNTTYQDTLANAINYFNTQGYSFPMLLDKSGNTSQTYQLNAVPLSILVNPDGEIYDVIIGSGMSEGYLRAYLDDIFSENNRGE